MTRTLLLVLTLLLAGCGSRAPIPTPPAIPTGADQGYLAPPLGVTPPPAGYPAPQMGDATSPGTLITPDVASLSGQGVPTTTLPVAGYRVVAQYPHDATAYTQGLVFYEGMFYESTGLNGASSLRHVALESGEVVQKHDLDPSVFGEGLALVGDRLIQLTWLSQVGYVYDRASFELLSTWEYPTEGWGLTYDGTRLIMSDGSDTLTFRDPETLAEIGQLKVTAEGQPVYAINELEMVGSELYANLYMSDLIARIDPTTGQVLGWIDLTGLLPAEQRSGNEDVLNGIAYDPATGRLFVTGKLWPLLYQIEVVEP